MALIVAEDRVFSIDRRLVAGTALLDGVALAMDHRDVVGPARTLIYLVPGVRTVRVPWRGLAVRAVRVRWRVLAVRAVHVRWRGLARFA